MSTIWDDAPWPRAEAPARPHVREKVVDKALDAALRAGDASRVVIASVEPIHVLVMDSRFDRLSREVERLLRLMTTEPNPVRRAEALRHLFDAVVLARRDVTIAVLDALVAACVEPLPGGASNLRGHALLAECLPAIARIDPCLAFDVLARLPGGALESAGERLVSIHAGADDTLVAWQRLSVY